MGIEGSGIVIAERPNGRAAGGPDAPSWAENGGVGDGHQHGSASDAGRGRLAIAAAITLAVFVAEVLGLVLTNSLALLIDAGHVAIDAAGLIVALVAATLVRRPASAKRTWGLARAEVLAATAQAAALLGIGLFVVVEAIRRLLDPGPVLPSGMLAVGVVALAGNIAAVAVMAGARRQNRNMRAAFLEVASDALGALAVIVAAIVVWTTGFTGADSIAAVVIGALILPRAFILLRETVGVLLESTPRGLDLDAVRAHMVAVPHVREVHDLHASEIATGLPVISAHVTLESECFRDGHAPEVLAELQQCVLEHFAVRIEHSTFQLEPASHRGQEHTVHS